MDMWHNELRFDVETCIDNEEMYGIRRWVCNLSMVWTVKCGLIESRRLTNYYHCEHPSMSEAIRTALQDVIEKNVYNQDTKIWNVDAPFHGELPWHVELSHLPEAIRETILAMFNGKPEDVFKERIMINA